MPSVSDAVSAAQRNRRTPPRSGGTGRVCRDPGGPAGRRGCGLIGIPRGAAAAGPLAAVYYFIMVPMVYLAILALLVGIVWRIAVILRSPGAVVPADAATRRPEAASLRRFETLSA